MVDIGSLTRWRLLALFAVTTAIFLAADHVDQHIGSSVVLAAPLDETAHFLTTLLAIWALGGVADRFLVPALVASVAIDLDHVPADFGATWISAGTPRPYTHSLLTIAGVLLLAVAWRRRRSVLVGVAIGLALHFWRDLAEPGTGVALLWPFSNASFSLPHASYLAGMTVIVIAGLARVFWGRRWQPSATGGESPRLGPEAHGRADRSSSAGAAVQAGTGV
ncbi:MAG: metal-dependent hydrolase [Solirubrobacteraceae bacterium]